jgi:transcriptional regulator with XRE-family HTH domain
MVIARWTGPDLRAERARRSRRAADVAQAAGVSRELISAIERKAAPSDRDVARYLAALGRLDTDASPDELAALSTLAGGPGGSTVTQSNEGRR